MDELEKLGCTKATLLGREVYLMDMSKDGIAYADFRHNTIIFNRNAFNSISKRDLTYEQEVRLSELLAHEAEHLIRGAYSVSAEDCTNIGRLVELYINEEQAINSKVAPSMYMEYNNLMESKNPDFMRQVEINAVYGAVDTVANCDTLLNNLNLSGGMIDYINSVKKGLIERGEE